MAAITQDAYLRSQEELGNFGLEVGQTYQTTAQNKVHLPVVDGRYGLNVLDAIEFPGARPNYRAMMRIEREADLFSVRYYGTAKDDTLEYLKPGVIHKAGPADIIDLVEPDIYDGYHMVVAQTGEIAVHGVIGVVGQQELVELPVFDRHPVSAKALLEATRRVINDRTPQPQLRNSA